MRTTPTAARLLVLHQRLLGATERVGDLLEQELARDDALADARQVGIYMDALCRGVEVLVDWLPSEVLAEEMEDEDGMVTGG